MTLADLIVKQGEPASAFYILISGRARVVNRERATARRSFWPRFGPGDSFGEAA